MKIHSDIQEQLEKYSGDIKDILGSSNLETEEKETLVSLFERLSRYNIISFDKMQHQVMNEIRKGEYGNESPVIKTRLMTRDSIKASGDFFEIENLDNISIADKLKDINELKKPAEKISKAGIFFRCSYEQFTELCGMSEIEGDIEIKGVSKTVKFRLSISDIYTQAEQLLRAAAELYGIRIPLIFSPYSRRFAELVFDDKSIDVSEITSVKLRGEKFSNIIYYFSAGYRLAWNLKIPSKAKDFDETDEKAAERFVGPDFAGRRYKVKISCSPDEYIVFIGAGCRHIAVGRSQDAVYACTDDESINFAQHQKIIVNSTSDDERSETFENYFRKNTFCRQRINTYADIEYILNCFRDNPYGVEIHSPEIYPADSAKPCIENEFTGYSVQNLRYYRRFKYSDAEKNAGRSIGLKSRVNCRIRFSGNRWYSGDFARYVLEYLNEWYSEYSWSGWIGE